MLRHKRQVDYRFFVLTRQNAVQTRLCVEKDTYIFSLYRNQNTMFTTHPLRLEHKVRHLKVSSTTKEYHTYGEGPYALAVVH